MCKFWCRFFNCICPADTYKCWFIYITDSKTKYVTNVTHVPQIALSIAMSSVLPSNLTKLCDLLSSNKKRMHCCLCSHSPCVILINFTANICFNCHVTDYTPFTTHLNSYLAPSGVQTVKHSLLPLVTGHHPWHEYVKCCIRLVALVSQSPGRRSGDWHWDSSTMIGILEWQKRWWKH